LQYGSAKDEVPFVQKLLEHNDPPQWQLDSKAGKCLLGCPSLGASKGTSLFLPTEWTVDNLGPFLVFALSQPFPAGLWTFLLNTSGTTIETSVFFVQYVVF
jgi:hypothetical protein